MLPVGVYGAMFKVQFPVARCRFVGSLKLIVHGIKFKVQSSKLLVAGCGFCYRLPVAGFRVCNVFTAKALRR
jgi:hypothetical protein